MSKVRTKKLKNILVEVPHDKLHLWAFLLAVPKSGDAYVTVCGGKAIKENERLRAAGVQKNTDYYIIEYDKKDDYLLEYLAKSINERENNEAPLETLIVKKSKEKQFKECCLIPDEEFDFAWNLRMKFDDVMENMVWATLYRNRNYLEKCCCSALQVFQEISDKRERLYEWGEFSGRYYFPFLYNILYLLFASQIYFTVHYFGQKYMRKCLLPNIKMLEYRLTKEHQQNLQLSPIVQYDKF